MGAMQMIREFKTYEEAQAEAAKHTRCVVKRMQRYIKDGGGEYTESWRVIIRNRDKNRGGV